MIILFFSNQWQLSMFPNNNYEMPTRNGLQSTLFINKPKKQASKQNVNKHKCMLQNLQFQNSWSPWNTMRTMSLSGKTMGLDANCYQSHCFKTGYLIKKSWVYPHLMQYTVLYYRVCVICNDMESWTLFCYQYFWENELYHTIYILWSLELMTTFIK